MANISSQLADLAIVRSLLIHQVSNGLSSDVAKVYNDIIEDLTTAVRGATPITLRNMNATIKELKERFTVDNSKLYSDLEDLAATEATFALNSVNSTVGVDVFSRIPPESTIRNIVATSLISDGKRAETINAWFSGIDTKMLNDIEGVVKQGVITGLTNQELSTNLSNVLGVSKNHAETITRTATSMVSNEARQAVYDANDDVIKGYEFMATLDSKVSYGCASRDSALYDTNRKPLNALAKRFPYQPVPRHFNCRSIYSVVLKEWKDLGIDIDEIPAGTRSSLDGQISAETTFDKWFEGKNKAFQEKYLGVSRYQLYKDGKITFKDLVNQKGITLPVSELGKVTKKVVVPKVVKPIVPKVEFGYDGKFDGYVKDIRDEAKIVIAKSPKPKTMKVGQGAYTQELLEVSSPKNDKMTFLHEYGHSIDDVLSNTKGSYVSTTRLLKAHEADMKLNDVFNNDVRVGLKDKWFTIEETFFTKGRYKGRLKGKTAIAKEEQFSNYSDIIDSMSNGRFHSENFAHGHGKKYYSSDRARQSENFANLFALWSDGKHWSEAKTLFPNLTSEFEIIMKEVVDG